MSALVVTGAASGMGKACAERLRSAADHLVVADVHPAVHDLARALDATAAGCDITGREDVARRAATAGEHGPLRALMHAAASHRRWPIGARWSA